MAYSPGELTERVTFEKEVRTPDGYGGNTVKWEDVATCWAHVRPRSGNEQFRAGKTEATSEYLVVVRARDDLSTAQRIQWRGHVLNVRNASPIKPRAQYMEIEAELGVVT